MLSPVSLPLIPGSQDHEGNLHESNHRHDLDERKDELRLSVPSDAKQIDGHDQRPEDGHPRCIGYVGLPKVDRNGSCDNLQRQHDEPLEGIIPAHGKAPCRVNEASRVVRERARHGEEDGHLTQGMDGTVQHATDQDIGDQQGSWTTGGQDLAGSDKQTGT